MWLQPETILLSFGGCQGLLIILLKCKNNWTFCNGQSQWPHGLRRRSSAAHLLRSWIWIPPGAWMFVCCECCVLSCRGLCDGLITRPEESYWLWHVVVVWSRNLENEEAKARYWAVENATTMGCNARKNNKQIFCNAEHV